MLSHSLLVAATLLSAPGASSPAVSGVSGQTYASYTAAYNEADGRPMLVVLNPAADSLGSRVDVEQLRQNTSLESELADFVVAEIDTGTEHGQKVYDLFDAPTLPHVVVIDSRKKQVYKTSGSMTAERLEQALQAAVTTPAATPVSVTSLRPTATSFTTPVQSAPLATSTSQPVVSSPFPASSVVRPSGSVPSVSTPLSIPMLSTPLPAAAPAGDCPSCRKYRAYQF